MTEDKPKAVLTEFISAAVRHCADEIEQMNRAAHLLEKAERQRLFDTYQDGQQWRGLASSDFTRMVDALAALREGLDADT